MKICYIEHCYQCKYCNYDEDEMNYEGGCMHEETTTYDIEDICKIPKWCPLEDKKVIK